MFFAKLCMADSYLGVGFNSHATSLKGLSNLAPYHNIHLGIIPQESLGFEIGLNRSAYLDELSKIKFNGFHALMLGYMPLNYDRTIKALGGIGFSFMSRHTTKRIHTSNLSSPIPKFMGGFEYVLNPFVHLRFALSWENYESLSRKEGMKFNNVYGLHFGFKFLIN